MATYNKRGYKPKTKPEAGDDNFVEEIDQQAVDNSTTAEVFSTLDEGANRTEEWFEKNQKLILIVLGALAAAALGYFLYKMFVVEPKQEEAINDVTQANIYYEQAANSTGTVQDSLYRLALNGGEGKYGLLKIASEYDGTDVGNLANYQIGMAYLNLGGKEYQRAIDYLTKYDGGDGVLEAMAKGGIGDALMIANQPKDAVSYFIEASETNPNDFTTPKFLLKAAQAHLASKNNKEAAVLLQKIVDEYPTSEDVATAKVLQAQADAAK